MNADTAPGPSPVEQPKPANPEPTSAPADPEKGHQTDPSPGEPEHPKPD